MEPASCAEAVGDHVPGSVLQDIQGIRLDENKTAKILVVDDAADTVAVLAFTLRRQGYDVSTAYSGEEALRLVAEEQPDLVLLDVSMPGIDGLEVCRRLKAEPRFESMPVILLTCLARQDCIVDGLEAGAHDYITKPFDHHVLAARLRSALREKAARDKLSRAYHAIEEAKEGGAAPPVAETGGGWAGGGRHRP
jgi:DNA-binding response OmpR family regulator